MIDNNVMSRIHKLDPYTSNKIAAGEVVERPAAVVKELVENAIDSGASQITIEIRKAGKAYIRVTDNGSGIHAEDIGLAFERHATSKIKEVKDLFQVESLGFRGEALASIASVSIIELITRTASEDMGIRIEMAGGKTNHTEATGSPQGTTVVVKDLFFNTPARMKFMKANSTETSYITDLVNKLAVSHPEIRFKYLIDQKEIFTTPGKNNLLNTILNIFDKSLVKNLLPVDYEDEYMKVTGFVSNFEYTRGNRQLQMFFVNGRYIKSKLLADALTIAYKSRLPINRFPICFLMIEMDFKAVDVNIHPAKTEIRFDEEHVIKQKLYQGIKRHLLHYNQVPSVSLQTKKIPESPISTIQNVGEHKVNTTFSSFKNPERPQVKEETSIYRPASSDKEAQNGNKVVGTMSNDLLKSDIVKESYDEVGSNKETKESLPNLKEEMPQVDDTPFLDPLVKDKVDPFLNQYFVKKDHVPVEQEQLIIDKQIEKQLDEKVSIYDDLRIIGQLFSTYILAEKNMELYMIDQHAAHEKILFEQFLKEYQSTHIVTQILLEPIVIDLDNTLVPIISSQFEAFEKLGLQMELFGEKSVIIREVPMLFDRPSSKAFAESLIENITEEGTQQHLVEYKLEKVILESCKSAIKANDHIHMPEINELIIKLKALDDPFTCPHGRPIMVQITKHEIERKFKRV